jgi:hypothetical protein
MDINYIQARAMVEMDSIFDILKIKYPETLDDMTSWKINSKCDCGQRFINFINKKHKEEDKVFFDSILENLDFISYTNDLTKKLSDENEKRQFSGKIIKIDRSFESWENLAKTLRMNKAVFKSFFILDTGKEELEVRFL